MVVRTIYVTCLWLALLLFAQVSLAQSPYDKQLIKGKLENGLTYYIYPNHFPKGEAVYRLFLKSGSNVEADSQRGLAHFLEHMAFNGTAHFPKDGMVKFLENKGAKFGKDLNAHTSYNETVYKLQLPSKDSAMVSKTMTILADWAHGMRLDSAEIEKERGVVLSEWLARRGPSEEAQEAFLSILLNHSRFAERKTIGDTAIIRHFKREALQAYYQQWYHPALMAVAIVGDVDPQLIIKLLHEKFDYKPTMKRPVVPDYSISNYEASGFKRVFNSHEQKIELSLLQLADSPPPVKRKDDYRSYLTRSLAQMLIKRRFSDLAFARPPYVRASLQRSRFLNTKDVIMATVEINPEKAVASIRVFAEQLEQMRRYGFTQNEIETVKKSYALALRQKMKPDRPIPSASIMDDIYADFYRDQPLISTKVENNWFQSCSSGIDSLALLRAFRQAYQLDNAQYLLTGYQQVADSMPANNEIKQLFDRVKQAPIQAYEKHTQHIDRLLDAAPQSGSLTDTVQMTPLQAMQMTLSNGATVIFRKPLQNDGKVTVSGFRKGGLYTFKESDYVSGLFATNVIALSGVGGFSRESLSQFLTGNSASVRFLIDKTRTGIAGSADLADMKTLFELIYLKWTAPQVDDSVFSLIKQKAVENARNTNQTPSSLFRRDLNALVNGWNYTTQPLADTLLQNQLQSDRMLPIFDRAFGTATGFTFIVTADPANETVKKLVLQYLGGLPSGHSDTTYRYVRPKSEPDSLVHYNGDSPKATVSLIFQQDQFLGSYNPLNMKLEMLTAVLRMKLLKKLREEMGMVYSVGVSGSATPYPTPLTRITISFNSKPTDVTTLLKSIQHILTEMAARPSSFENELADVKSNLLKEMEADKQRDAFWTGYIRNSIFNHDTDWNFVRRYTALVEAVSAADMAQMLTAYMLETTPFHAILYPQKSGGSQENNTENK